jgi:hypothetical protein
MPPAREEESVAREGGVGPLLLLLCHLARRRARRVQRRGSRVRRLVDGDARPLEEHLHHLEVPRLARDEERRRAVSVPLVDIEAHPLLRLGPAAGAAGVVEEQLHALEARMLASHVQRCGVVALGRQGDVHL